MLPITAPLKVFYAIVTSFGTPDWQIVPPFQMRIPGYICIRM